ncbi:hypothetical protein CMI37_32280 [Candidatus Pacearchaeota archaeon]|nr:hypothetical protein [Candidatus Pacearchaeota archaeon]
MAEPVDLTQLPPELQAYLNEFPQARRRAILAKLGVNVATLFGFKPTPPPEDDTELRRRHQLAALKLKQGSDKIKAEMVKNESTFAREYHRWFVQLHGDLGEFAGEIRGDLYSKLDKDQQRAMDRGMSEVEEAKKQRARNGWDEPFEAWSRGEGMNSKMKATLQSYEAYRGSWDKITDAAGKEIFTPVLKSEDRVGFFQKLYSDLQAYPAEETAFIIAQLQHWDTSRAGSLNFDLKAELGLYAESDEKVMQPGGLLVKPLTTGRGHYPSLLEAIRSADAVRKTRESVDATQTQIIENAYAQMDAVDVSMLDQRDQAALREAEDQRRSVYDAIMSIGPELLQAEEYADNNPVQYDSGAVRPPPNALIPTEIEIRTEEEVTGEPGEPSVGVPAITAPGGVPLPGVTAPEGVPSPVADPTGAAVGAPTRGTTLFDQLNAALAGTQEDIVDFVKSMGDEANQNDPAYQQMAHYLLADPMVQKKIKQEGWENVPNKDRFRWMAEDMEKQGAASRSAAYDKRYGRGDKKPQELFYGKKLGENIGGLLTAAGTGLNKLKDESGKEQTETGEQTTRGEPTEADAQAASRPADAKPAIPDESTQDIFRRANKWADDREFDTNREGIVIDDINGTLYVSNGIAYWYDWKSGRTVRVSGDKSGQELVSGATGKPLKIEPLLEEFRQKKQGALYDETRDIESLEDLDIPDITREGKGVQEQGRAASRYNQQGELIGSRGMGDVREGQTLADIKAIEDLQTSMGTDPRFRVGTTRLEEDTQSLPFFIHPSEIDGMTFREAKSFIQSKFDQEGLKITDEDLDELVSPYRPRIPAGTVRDEERDIVAGDPGVYYDQKRRDALKSKLDPTVDPIMTDVEQEKLDENVAKRMRQGQAQEDIALQTAQQREWKETEAEEAARRKAELQSDVWGTTTAAEQRKKKRKEDEEWAGKPWGSY